MTQPYFNLTLDTSPPADPAVLINSGAASTGSQNVLLTITTSDYTGGAADVTQMLIWGDVDPAADGTVQPTEGASAWIAFAETKVIRLSAGSGRKTIFVILQDDVGNPTVVFSDFIDLNVDVPIVSITTPVSNAKVSLISPFNQSTFSWEVDRAFVAYQVRAVPNAGSSNISGVPLGTTNGSSNVSGTGSFTANTPITTLIKAADLVAASPGNTTKVIKVFAQYEDGTWSA